MNDHHVRLEIFALLSESRAEVLAVADFWDMPLVCPACDGTGVAEFLTKCGCWHGFDSRADWESFEDEKESIQHVQDRIFSLGGTFRAKARPTRTQWMYWLKDKSDPRAFSCARLVKNRRQ